MNKLQLIWNITLTVLLLAGFALGFWWQDRNIKLIDAKIQVVDDSVVAMNHVMAKQADVINAQAGVIDEHARLMNGEYLAAIQADQVMMEEMAGLIDQYREIVKRNALYFEEMQDNLQDLSLAIPQ